MAMEVDTHLERDFSGCSTSTIDDDQARNSNHLFPTAEWRWSSSSRGDDYFPNIIESGTDDGCALDSSRSFFQFETPCTSTSSDMMLIDDDGPAEEGSRDLRLVHLLMAAAEALNGSTRSRELARVILLRLKELVSANGGTNMERLAAHFTDALQGLLDGGAAVCSLGAGHRRDEHRYHHTEVLAAFQILQDLSPYVKFGHFTANQAILEAVVGSRRIHIVDYDIMEGIQWASLMQALVSSKDGVPPPHLRITALSRGGGQRRPLATVQETGRRLVAFAASIGQPFSFHQCRVDSDERFKQSGLKLCRGEALVINCMLHLPHSGHQGSESVASFLSGSRSLNPKLVTLVEEELVPAGEGGFVGRFMDLLHHYSAVYDSLEAGFPMKGWARGLVERVFLGPRIVGSLPGIYQRLGEEERCLWREWLGEVGYKEVSVSFANHCQSKLLLGLFNDGYRVEELAVNALVLGWKTRNLVSASVWTSDSES